MSRSNTTPTADASSEHQDENEHDTGTACDGGEPAPDSETAAIETLRERVAALEASLADTAGSPDKHTRSTRFRPSRRGVLAALTGVGVLGVASQPASAHHAGHDHVGDTWSGSTDTDAGLEVTETSGTGVTKGLVGIVDSSTDHARGVYGVATADSGNVKGVEGVTHSASENATAMVGNALATSGNTMGLLGRNASSEGTGLVGHAHADTGNTTGLLGLVDSPNGQALRGAATATSGETYGVIGEVESPDGYGLYTPDDAKVDGTLATDSTDVRAVNDETLYLERPVESGDIETACETLAEYGGGEIVLPAGTWTGQFAVTTHNVTLRGRSQRGVELRTPDGVDAPEQLLTVVADDCVIEHLTLNGNKQNQDVSSYSKSELQHADTLGIYGDRCTVRDVTALNAMSHSIICRDYGTQGDASSGLTDGVVAAHRHGDEYVGTQNTYVDCRTEASGLPNNLRASLDTRDCTRTVIEDCEVYGDDHTIVGITVHGGDNITFRNNYVENRPKNLGIQIHSEAYGVKVLNNHLVGGLGGIQLYNDTDDVLLSGNTVEGSADMTSIYQIGGTASNIRLEEETVRGGNWQAVHVGDQTRDIRIEHCTFEDIYTAITVSGDVHRNLDIHGCRVRNYEHSGIRCRNGTMGVTIRDCRFIATETPDSAAISLVDTHDASISENTFVDISNDIYQDNTTNIEIRHNRTVSST